MKVSLYPEMNFSNGFQYPKSFIDIISEDNVIDLEPWWFLLPKKVIQMSLHALTALQHQEVLKFIMSMPLHHQGGKIMALWIALMFGLKTPKRNLLSIKMSRLSKS